MKVIAPVVIVMLLNVGVAYGNQDVKVPIDGIEQNNVLTYTEATQKALNYSFDLKNQQGALEKLEATREGKVLLSYPSGYGNGEEDANRLNTLKSLKSLDVNIEMSKKQIEITKENLALEVRNAMNEVNILLNEQVLLELEIENTRINFEMAKTKAARGMISRYDLEKEQDTFNQKMKEKDLFGKTVENAYMKLNSLMGISQKDRYDLEEDITYEPIGEVDIDYLVVKVISESPTIWSQEKKIELATLDLDLYVFNAGGDSYAAKKIDLQLEKNNLASQKLNLEQSIRATYNQIQQLEKNYELLEANFKSAERSLGLARAQYKLGMVAKNQLKQGELGVIQTKHEIGKKVVEHEKLKIQLHEPYLSSK